MPHAATCFFQVFLKAKPDALWIRWMSLQDIITESDLIKDAEIYTIAY